MRVDGVDVTGSVCVCFDILFCRHRFGEDLLEGLLDFVAGIFPNLNERGLVGDSGFDQLVFQLADRIGLILDAAAPLLEEWPKRRDTFASSR